MTSFRSGRGASAGPIEPLPSLHAETRMDALRKTAQIITGQWGINVVFKGARAYTDGKTIVVPSLPEDAPDDLVDAIIGFLDHESGHILDTDMNLYDDPAREAAKLADRRLHPLVNAIEDIRMEAKHGARYRGVGLNLQASNEWAYRKLAEKWSEPGRSLFFKFMLLLLAHAKRKDIPFCGEFFDAHVGDFSLIVKPFLPRAEAWAGLGSTVDAYNEAVECLRILDAMKPEEQQGDDDGDSGSDGDQQPQDVNDLWEPEKKEQDKKPGKSDQSGDSDSSECEGDEKSEGNGSGDGESTGEPDAGDEEPSDGSKPEAGSDDADDSAGGSKKGDEDEGDGDDQAEGAGADEAGGDRPDGEDGGEDGGAGKEDADDQTGGSDAEDGGSDAEDGDEPDAGSDGEDRQGSGAGDEDLSDEAENEDDGDAGGEDGVDEEDSAGGGSQGGDDDGDGEAGDGNDADDDDEADGGDAGSGDEEVDDEADGEACGDKADGEPDAAEDDGDELSGDETGGSEDSPEASDGRRDDSIVSDPVPSGHRGIVDALCGIGGAENEEIDDTSLHEFTAEQISVDCSTFSGHRPWSEEFDMVVEPRGDATLDDYSRMRDSVRDAIATVAGVLTRTLITQSRAMTLFGRHSGAIAMSSIAQLRAHNPAIFQKKIEGRRLDTYVELVVDHSGSMGMNEKIYTATKTCIVLAEALEKVGVPFGVSGFTTGIIADELTRAQQARAREFMRELNSTAAQDFERLEPIIEYRYKTPDEPFAKMRERLALMPKQFMGANADGDSIYKIAKRVAKRREKRKVIIVLSDGFPACSQGDGVDGDAAERYMRRVADVLARTPDMDLIGIGIKSDAVKHYYKRFAVVSNISQLPAVAMGELKQALLGK